MFNYSSTTTPLFTKKVSKAQSPRVQREVGLLGSSEKWEAVGALGPQPAGFIYCRLTGVHFSFPQGHLAN